MLAFFLVLLLPEASSAHSTDTGSGTFYGGMLSPIFLTDHLLLLTALAAVTIQQGNRIYRLVVPLFTFCLITAVLLSNHAEVSNSMFFFNLLLIFILGLFTALPGKMHVILLGLLSGMAGVFLGYDIVAQTYDSNAGTAFQSGIIMSEFLLLTVSAALVPQHFLVDKKSKKVGVSGVILGGTLLLLTLYLASNTTFSLDIITLPNEEHLIGMVATEQMSLMFICTTIFLSFLWGAGHALTPGHGKAIVAAYLIGARSTAWHAFYLGLTVTITHTLGIFCLGFIALFASQYILPETLFPWLALLSGCIVIILGFTMFASRLRLLVGKASHHHHHHPHGDHHHSHDHGHTHQHGHSHLPPEDKSVSWKTIIGLGISGGLLPCPSALVLLLAAISMQRIGFGMFLVFVFSIGLAAVLTSVGLLFIKGSHIIQKIPQASAATRILPVMSAVLIFVLGVFISADAMKAIQF